MTGDELKDTNIDSTADVADAEQDTLDFTQEPCAGDNSVKDKKARRRGYVDFMVASARKLHDRDAFEPAQHMLGNEITAADALATTRHAARSSRRLVVVFAIIVAVLGAFSLCLPYRGFDTMGVGGDIYSPADVIDCYVLWFQMNVAPLFDYTLYNRTGLMLAEFIETHDSEMYTLVINRAAVTFIVVLCGIMLALSGLLFQTAYRNPLAVPSSLGVSDGVTLGCIVFTMMGYSSIYANPGLYVLVVYGLGAACVVFVLLASRVFSGGARYNVLDMLLLGTVVAQLLNGIGSFIQNFVMDYTTWDTFYDVQQAAGAAIIPAVQIVVVVVFVVTFIPALFLRFRLNLITFGNDDGRLMGSHAGALRIGALVLGSAMQLAAIASIGPVAMLSLAVPFIVRYMMPADFRSQFLGNCLVGVAVLMACMCIQHFATIGFITVPVGTIVGVFIVPFFIWMVAFGHGRWD